MWVQVSNVYCRVIKATEDEEDWVRRYLSFETSGYLTQGGRVTLYKEASGTFPGGLLPLLRDAASRDGVKIEELDKRVSRVQPDPAADLAWLRDYQRDAVEACVREKRGIVRAPTGSGKTEMFVALTRRVPGKWLMLVHRDTLVEQAAVRYRLRTKQIPNVLSRTPPHEWKLINGFNAMTLQTLASALRKDKAAVDKALADLDGLVIDEAHVAPANVYFDAINRCPAEYRLGFSGTPLDRTDNRSLMAIAALGRVIYAISARELIAAGILAAPRIVMVQARHPRTVGLEYRDVYDKLVVESDIRNDLVVELAKKAQKPCMVFVKIIEHGKVLKDLMEREGLQTEFVWGSTKSKQRADAIERLERRDSDVMIASVVFQEGVDIPSLESVVIASGGKSVIAALQRIGRGMRTNNGAKSEFDVIDILDTGSPMLEKHSRRRMNTYVREGYETVIRRNGLQDERYQPRLLTRAQKRARRA